MVLTKDSVMATATTTGNVSTQQQIELPVLSAAAPRSRAWPPTQDGLAAWHGRSFAAGPCFRGKSVYQFGPPTEIEAAEPLFHSTQAGVATQRAVRSLS
jgi:hypothetical protein